MKMQINTLWKKSFYSALVFFGTLIMFSMGYAAFQTINSDEYTSGQSLTSSLFGKVVSSLVDHENRITSLSGTISSLYLPVIVLEDIKAAGTSGGTCTLGSWLTRDITTKVMDTKNLALLTSNQFTLPAGTYIINASAPAGQSGNHQAKLRNISDAADVISGTSEYAGQGAGYPYTRSIIYGKFTITSPKIFEIQHRCTSTGTFGYASNFGTSEVYTIISLTKTD